MLSLLVEGRALTNDWHYPHIGEFLFNYCMIACHLDPLQHIHLWQASEQLAGFAMLGEDPKFDFHVHPEFEWLGIEAEAIAWAETRLAQLRRQNPQRWAGDLVSGARQDDPRRMAFLEEHGFHQGGEFSEVNMLRSLDGPISELVLPAGCQVRSIIDPGEITDRAEAHREVWYPWTDGNVSNNDYAFLMQLPGYDLDLDVVAVAADGVIAAFVNGWIDTLNKIGDLGPVGARPAYRRQGLTRAVLLECLRRMQAHGMKRVCVSTGVSNLPAIGLYESVGFKVVNRYLEYVKTGSENDAPSNAAI